MKRKIENNIMHVLDDDGTTVLSVTVTTNEDTTILAVSGSITHEAAPEFEDELMSVLTSGRDVAVDFASLEYISAPALNTLLSIQKLVDKKRYKFYIQNLSDPVKAIFEQSGFIDLIEIRMGEQK